MSDKGDSQENKESADQAADALPRSGVEMPQAEAEMKALPALASYQKTYALSLGNNDGKAIKLFKEFESSEKIRRLKSELLAVAQGRVADPLCCQVLGSTRKGRHGSFQAWAKFALGFVHSAAR